MSIAQVLEGVMLLCFGVSWPVAILKTWRAKRVEGKSGLFLVLILAGYLAGLVSKFVRAAQDGVRPEAVTALYGLNALLVAVDLTLFLRYRTKAADGTL